MSSVNSAKQMDAERQKLRALHGRKKLRYLWDYYKFPFAVLCIAVYIIGYAIYGHATHKETLLYTALVNVNAGEELTADLSSRFLEAEHADSAKTELHLYSGLYLTDDADSEWHQYTYASQMKILASIDAEELDVVLMNREAFDAFSQNGYLCDLSGLLEDSDPDLYSRLRNSLVTNISILEDNSADLAFDDTVTYQAETEEYPMGLDLSSCPVIKSAGFGDTVYLGVIANSPRKEAAVQYLAYLYQ